MEPTTLDSQTISSPFDAEIRRTRGLIEDRRFADALSLADELLAQAPRHRDVLYMRAVALRFLGQIPDALEALELLETVEPGFPRLHQERGHCYIGLRAPEPAIAAFRQAVQLDSALMASWTALVTLYKIVNRPKDAELASQQVIKLSRIPKEILAASNLYADGQITQAEDLVRRYLVEHGDHVEGMRLLAKIAMDAEVAEDAEVLLEAVLRLDPDYHSARYDYVLALLRQQRHAAAISQIDILLKRDPDSAILRTTYATIHAGIGEEQKAVSIYQDLLNKQPRAADIHLSLAHVQKTLGDQSSAIASYRRAIEVQPQFGEAYWSLANLKTYGFTDAEISSMRGEEASPSISHTNRYHLCFALGKALEDRKDFAASFHYYSLGNQLKHEEQRYSPEPIERNVRLQKTFCTKDFFAARTGWGNPDPSPIFVVGLPRAGSTLLEQILASHSQIEGTMELAIVPRIVSELYGYGADRNQPRYPDILAQLSEADFRRLGDRYLEESRSYRKGAALFIDKMPNNFRHIALIQLMLPNAKIIDARREPMACCFGNFKQLFASGQQFTYSLDDIARYYISYVELMSHYDETLPGRVLRVQHEDVIDDLEGSVRRILDYCGVAFEAACLSFHQTARSIHTASSEQVRRPINRDGVDQWKQYEQWLGPLLEALRPVLRD